MENDLIEKYKQEMLNMKSRATAAAPAVGVPSSDGVGSLVVNVTTLDQLYPVSGAVVSVFVGRDNERTEVDRDISDESGRTKLFNLSSPPKANSESAENTQPTYSLYNIAVTADGFIEQIYYGIPIFSGVTSIKVADLISLSVAGGNTSPQVFEETVDYNL